MIPSFSIMGISKDFENMAKKIQEYASTQQHPDGIQDLVLQLENVCTQACKELKEEYNRIKKTNMMTNENKIKLFLVDDDALFLKSLEIEFTQNTDSAIETFATGELCLENLSQNPDVIILDYHLDGIDKNAMNGIETLDKIKAINPDIPVIMLSSQDKIEVAVNCMHHQAFDYIVKSETAFIRLQKTITTIFHYQKIEKALSWYMEKM